MPLFRSELQRLLESTICSLGWTLAPADRNLGEAMPNTAPLQVAWRWVSISTRADPAKPGGPGQPMTKAMTWTLEYAVQVHSSVRQDAQYKWLAADMPDLLASVLLDRRSAFWSGVRNLTTDRQNYVHGIEIADDVINPPNSTNANGQAMGYLSFVIRADIDVRTDLALSEVGE